MPDSEASPSVGKPAKRSLPPWRQNESRKKPVGSAEQEDSGDRVNHKVANTHEGERKSNTVDRGVRRSENPIASNKTANSSSKLLDGVVFVLSGFVNPERGILRSQALEMGAEYQPDWNSSCTLLVCAFPNTPKFRQVEADNGTIVSKDWISECYSQKKLVDIEIYLMHAGKPWRRSSQSNSNKANQDQKTSADENSHEKIEGGAQESHSNKTFSATSKKMHRDLPGDLPSPSKVKNWVMDDLDKTISWLESQEEKPEAEEIKKIAAEGILTCLQDAIDALEQNKDVRGISEQWNILPQAVEKLIKLEGSQGPHSSTKNKGLCKWALDCKRVYEAQYRSLEGDPSGQHRKPNTEARRGKNSSKDSIANNEAEYDSDETIEMTEEEIDLAYNRVASKAPQF